MISERQSVVESGMNELEIIEFKVNNQHYGMNVYKVKEIVTPLAITPIPHAHPFILGITQLRGEVLPVISLRNALVSNQDSYTHIVKDDSSFLIVEFNKQKVIFHVDEVRQIHRLSWDQIDKPDDIYNNDNSYTLGVVKQSENMILMLDFEKILTDINPNIGFSKDDLKADIAGDKKNARIVIAEDSPMLRSILKETLNKAGFQQLLFFENGEECYNHLASEENKVDLVITDIEMPLMNGHFLTKYIKQDSKRQSTPVVIFSSLITEDLLHQGRKVGADAQVSKPDIQNLVNVILELL
ncbi:chemotaxis protein [Cytobacillus kochii]|uniref:chemotaxis protein n=1 Tax=Cytobacillus kochii TaxID=859143 RepID=UPI00203A77AD|nr:chemotaxis protein [Cytobacillus kochii]MCM3321897.1 chemotaxis protein [Cytobacillus kochii]MCM3343269.1 chemotaxis protein [Cytobacillus kochii]